jgi:hypothetical protein
MSDIARIGLRHDTAVNWETENPTLEVDETVIVDDTGAVVRGDGNQYNASIETIGYLSGGGGLVSQSQVLAKTVSDEPVVEKTALFALQASQDFSALTDDGPVRIAAGTSVDMTIGATVGQDYALWVSPAGNIIADDSHEVAPVTGAVKIGGFHYAPGGNAALDANGNWANHTGGDTTPQINEYSIWDLKFRPAVDDPRGLALVPGLNEWWGIYPMSNGNEGGPLHMYGVDPCRDGNAPYKMWADTPAQYNDATPMNIFELLAYHGFRPPAARNFQFAALGTTEETSAGGSGPGLTGDMSDARDKERFTSAWGLFDITGVIRAWAADSLPNNVQENGVTQGRSDDVFRIERFANLGGSWGDGSDSGSRSVTADTSSNSNSGIGGRGVTDHLVIP